MIGPGGPNSYATPAQLGGLSVVGLPLGYFFLVGREERKIVGAYALAAMALVLGVAWAPLISEEWMLETHGGWLAAWSVVWLIAAAPFAIAVARR